MEFPERCAGMSNLVYRLVQQFNRGAYAQAAALFHTGCGRVTIDRLGVDAAGYAGLAEALRTLRPAAREISMTKAPNYFQPDAAGAHLVCDSYTYRFTPRDATLYICRIEADAREENGALRLTGLAWRTIQSMVPWQGAAARAKNAPAYVPLPPEGACPPADYVAIRNLQNYFFERPLNGRLPLLTDDVRLQIDGWCDLVGKDAARAQLAAWTQAERDDHGRLILVGLTGTPVITARGADAAASFLVELFDTNRLCCADTLIRTFYDLHAAYRRVSGEWRISEMTLRKLDSLPPEPYDGGVRYDHMSQCPGQWIGGNTPTGHSAPADVFAIETLISHWVYANRRGEMLHFYRRHMQNPKTQPVLHICSRGEEASPPITGGEAIAARLAGMDSQFHLHFFSYHAETTPVIEIAPDGCHARGTWFDHSATCLYGDRREDGIVPYMPFVFKYNHAFEKIGGVWYLTHFYGKPLISLRDWYFDPAATEGLAGEDSGENYPLPRGYLEHNQWYLPGEARKD